METMNPKNSLKNRIIKYFLLVSILPVMLLGIVTYISISNSITGKFLDRTTTYISSNVSSMDNWFMRFEKTVSNLSTDYDVYRYYTEVNTDTINQTDIYRLISTVSTKSEDVINLNNDQIDFLMLIPVNSEGYPLYKGKYIMGSKNINIESLDIISEAIKNKDRIVWDRIYNSSGSQIS